MTYHRPTTHAVARDGRAERRYELCPKCGKYQKDPWQYVCLNCEAKSAERQAGKWRGIAGPSETASSYVLLDSPEWSWRRGGVWQGRDLRVTLEMGHMTPGTVFERGGKRLVVVGAEGEPQRLEEERCSSQSTGCEAERTTLSCQ